ncbi:hypothetical protein Tco_0836624 [Tanacetum coccineum]
MTTPVPFSKPRVVAEKVLVESYGTNRGVADARTGCTSEEIDYDSPEYKGPPKSLLKWYGYLSDEYKDKDRQAKGKWKCVIWNAEHVLVKEQNILAINCSLHVHLAIAAYICRLHLHHAFASCICILHLQASIGKQAFESCICILHLKHLLCFATSICFAAKLQATSICSKHLHLAFCVLQLCNFKITDCYIVEGALRYKDSNGIMGTVFEGCVQVIVQNFELVLAEPESIVTECTNVFEQ